MIRSEEVFDSGYRQDLSAGHFNVSRKWDYKLDEQRDPEMGDGELVYQLERAAKLAGDFRITPSDRVSGSKYLVDERMHGDYVRDHWLAIKFGKAVLFDFEMSQEYNGDLGLIVDRDDINGIRNYGQLGFSQAGVLRLIDTHIIMLRPGILSRLSIITSGDI